MTKETGGHAFPLPAQKNEFGVYISQTEYGMTLRDWFAGQALGGLLQDTNYDSDIRELTVSEAYLIAGAMLKARGA